MGRRFKQQSLGVAMNGVRVGSQTRSGAAHEFRYVHSWLEQAGALPISLSLPLTQEPHKGDRVAWFFENVLPDDPAVRERVQRSFGAASTSAFDLLAEAGRDCVGALQFFEGDQPPAQVDTQANPLTSAEVSDVLRGLQSSDHSRWIRLPQEDMCQALGVSPGQKYGAEGGPGLVRILNLLAGSSNLAEDRAQFLSAQIVYWMLAAIDGHANNFSIFIEPGGSYRLAPVYDVISAHPVVRTGQLHRSDLKMAMALEGKSRDYQWQSMRRRHWVQTAARAGLGERTTEALIERLTSAAAGVADAVASRLPAHFPESVSQAILEGLRAAADRLADDGVT